jgi:hypothetical protein
VPHCVYTGRAKSRPARCTGSAGAIEREIPPPSHFSRFWISNTRQTGLRIGTGPEGCVCQGPDIGG